MLIEVRKAINAYKNHHVKEYGEIDESENKILRWTFIGLAVILFLVGSFHGAFTLAIPLHLYWFEMLWLRIPIFLVACYIINLSFSEEQFSTIKKLFTLPGERSDDMKIRWGRVTVISTITVVLLISGLFFPAFIPRTIGYLRADTFKPAIESFEHGTIDIFPEIDPGDLRVTTSGIAISIAGIKKTSAESKVTSVHLGEYGGELGWICTLSAKPLFGFALLGDSNRIREAIFIPLNDSTGESSQVIPFTGNYGEGLWIDKAMNVHANDRFPLRTFSRCYISSMDEQLVYVTTSYTEIPILPFFGGLLTDPRVHVWDPTTGALIAEYTPNDAPEHIIQRWDERFLEIMGNSFGDYRWDQGDNLNYWAGFIKHSDRGANPSEADGLRYQEWNGELTAVYLFDNKRNEKILEMALVATNEKLTLYSLDHLSLLSPDDAKELAVTGLPALPGKEQKSYSTPLALVYRIGSKLYYHIPVYIKTTSGRSTQYYPAHFALVDCESRTLFREPAESGGMIQAVEELYLKLQSDGNGDIPPIQERTITGTLKDKDEWTDGGNTRMWLTIDENGTDINVLVKAELLSPEEIHIILDKEVGQTITVKVDEDNIVTEVIS